MITYDEIKKYITQGNYENLDDDSKLLLLLCKNHSNIFDDIIIQYLPHNVYNINDIQKIMKNRYSYIYFRFFYIFYLIVKYIYHEINYKKDNLKQIFNYFVTYIKHNKYDQVMEELLNNYEYLYETFFINDNVYFNIYFNNLIKHFLPLPYQYLIHCPILTYRHHVNTFYKKNDIDYLDQIEDLDRIDRKRYTGPKNIDKIKNELDIHIPIKYYNHKLFAKNTVKLIGVKIDKNHYKLFITRDLTMNKKITINNVEFIRNFHGYDEMKYKEGYPFQLISERWETTSIAEFNFDIDQIVYISVMRLINNEDLYHVFNPMDIKTKNYQYLFHNTAHDVKKNNVEHILNNPSFFYFTPMGSESYIDKYFKDRSCLIFKIKEDIRILDLTQSIIVSNPFNKYDKLKNQKQWEFYDYNEILNYYDNKDIPLITNENNKCITHEEIDITEFIKKRPYCDIGAKQYYVGRRKLYEIFIKNRKYEISTIWPPDYLMELFLPLDIHTCNYIIELLYNRKYIPTDVKMCDYILDELYYDPNMIYSNILAYLYDAFLLKTIGYTGFFFTDFEEAFRYGGELFLSDPQKFIEPYKYSNKTCNQKTTFQDLSLKIFPKRQIVTKNKYAYVALLMGDSPYFLGALVMGYSLKTVNTNYDIVIMVTPDVPNDQKEVLKDFYHYVIDIDFITIDKRLIKNYETNRFKDVFTKLQCLTLTQYNKIIMIDIDMLVVKNMDHLFDLKAPAASLRKYDLINGQKIPQHLIVKNNKLIGGINAGLMLLQPDQNEYNDIVKDLLQTDKEREAYDNPEQDYLSYRYSKDWTNVSFLYNFQFGLTDRAKKYDPNDIHNIHYSSRLKPWRIIFKPEETWSWIKEDIRNISYYELWMKAYDVIKNRLFLRNIDLDKLYPNPYK